MSEQWQETQDAGLPGYLLVMQKERWGIWSEEKGLILPCAWRYIRRYRDGLAAVFKDDYTWGLVDENGNWLTPCRWKTRSTYDDVPTEQESNGCFVNGYAVIGEEDRLGCIKHNGEISHPCFLRNWIRLGYMDRSGKIISPCIWDLTCSFDSEGHPALVFRRDGNYKEAPGDWGGQHDWYWYYEEIPQCKIHPNNADKYCRYGYFYLTPKGTVLTPRGEITLTEGDIDAQLGRGWLHAEPFSGGKARVRDTDIDAYNPDEGWETITWNPEP